MLVVSLSLSPSFVKYLIWRHGVKCIAGVEQREVIWQLVFDRKQQVGIKKENKNHKMFNKTNLNIEKIYCLFPGQDSRT